jgi:4-oxalocrotonate tautomerase
MPFANLKTPAGSVTTEQKQDLVEGVTKLYTDLWGEGAGPNTMVLVDEVVEGGWGIGGDALTLARLQGKG